MQNIKIYLPFFGGFYESIHDFQDDFIIDDFIDSVKNDY